MRKMMTKEVTTTTVKVARIEIQNGLPQAVSLEDEIMLGNVSQEKAQKHVNKKHGSGVTVISVTADTVVYELAVEEFIKIASIKTDEVQEELVLA